VSPSTISCSALSNSSAKTPSTAVNSKSFDCALAAAIRRWRDAGRQCGGRCDTVKPAAVIEEESRIAFTAVTCASRKRFGCESRTSIFRWRAAQSGDSVHRRSPKAHRPGYPESTLDGGDGVPRSHRFSGTAQTISAVPIRTRRARKHRKAGCSAFRSGTSQKSRLGFCTHAVGRLFLSLAQPAVQKFRPDPCS
jgi:hypothetical protein